MEKERRENPRVPYQVPVAIKYKDSFWHAESRDISSDGMFISSNTFPKMNAEVELIISLPGIQSTSIVAYVKWFSRMGFGVQFKLLSEKETHAVNTIDGSEHSH